MVIFNTYVKLPEGILNVNIKAKPQEVCIPKCCQNMPEEIH